MSINSRFTLIIGILANFASYAGEENLQRQTKAGVVSYADVLQWMLSLGAVLLIFGLFVWMLRKAGQFSIHGKSDLAIIAGLSLGMREKLVLVKVGKKQLLLGVTPGRVDKLMELEGEERLFQSRADISGAGTFANRLQQVLQSKADV
ncbi:flagellar biosynthetic protein FliO [Methylomonas sp. MgM2]